MGKRIETDSAPFIIQEQQAEWVNAQRQILRPLSFRSSEAGDKRAKIDFAPFVIQKRAIVSGGMQRQVMVILYLPT